jgi:5-methylcytosine-specific restriction endonuclease McrA
LKAKDQALKKRRAVNIDVSTKSADYAARENYYGRIYIPQVTKALVYAQASYCCEYVSRDGKRCDQRTHLHIDHKHPLFLGGSNEISNLQILCAGHHRMKSREELGRSWEAYSLRPFVIPIEGVLCLSLE